MLEVPTGGVSSRPRLWLLHRTSVTYLILLPVIFFLTYALMDSVYDTIYVFYFTASVYLIYFSSNFSFNRWLITRFYYLLLLVGCLQCLGILPNFWVGDNVQTEMATGFSSEPSFFALLLYWLILRLYTNKRVVLFHVFLIFLLTHSFSLVLMSVIYLLFAESMYRISPFLVFLYLIFISNVNLPSVGSLTLTIMGSWRELATESLLVSNLLNVGGSIKQMVYDGQDVLSGGHLNWIDTSYSLISILSVWNTFFALLVFWLFLRKAESTKQKHLIFVGFLFVPKWMLFYLMVGNDTGFRFKKRRNIKKLD